MVRVCLQQVQLDLREEEGYGSPGNLLQSHKVSTLQPKNNKTSHVSSVNDNNKNMCQFGVAHEI